jgi:hypothetical protein
MLLHDTHTGMSIYDRHGTASPSRLALGHEVMVEVALLVLYSDGSYV